jgi:membrane fusion protein, peptide pheromone/bacteriocin exporter
MKKQLFPAEIIENSQENNFSKHSVKSKTIYSTIVLFLTGIFVVLPFISVDVGVRTQGLIRPVTELIQLSSPVSGHIQTLNATENSFVRSGEVVAVIEAPQLTEQLRFNENRQRQLEFFLNDLKVLLNAVTFTQETSINLASPRYQNAYLEFNQQLLNQKLEVDQLSRNLQRGKFLFESEAISKSALEETRFALQTAENHYKLLVEQQQNRWNLEKITFQDELDELKSEYTRLREELRRYEIRSPVSGTVQNIAGIFQNSFVYANQVLGKISPDTNIVAEAYVLPGDIGLLREGMQVRLQIDAYNYNQWGIASGKIKTISTDVLMNDDQPVFRVRCSLDQTFLELPNGFRGEIKKGMTFQARFVVSRRTLFQLLYDKVDDWLNPAWGENENRVYAEN